MELYGMLTTRSQDLSDSRIAELDIVDLQCQLAYYLGEGRDILLPYLLDSVKQLARAK